MDALHETGVNGLEPFRVTGNITGQKTEELSEHRVILFGSLDARPKAF